MSFPCLRLLNPVAAIDFEQSPLAGPLLLMMETAPLDLDLDLVPAIPSVDSGMAPAEKSLPPPKHSGAKPITNNY